MVRRCLKCLSGLLKPVLLAFYLFVLYELVMVPAVLDWSTFGVILVIALTGLLIWCIPVEDRLSTTVLGTTYLLAVKAIGNIKEYPFLKHAFSTLFIFLVLLIAGKILGRFRIRRFVAMFLVALIIGTTLDISEVRFWSEFTVKWKSPLLYKKLAAVDYFPTVLGDVDGDGIKEIITQQNLGEAAREQQERVANGIRHSILEPEKNYFAVYKWDGRKFAELPPNKYSLARLKAVLPRDYIGFPFYQSSFKMAQNRTIEEWMDPLVDRAALAEQATSFASFPFKILALSHHGLRSRLASEKAVGLSPASSIAAVGNLVPGLPDESVIMNNSLNVREAVPTGKVVASLTPGQVPDIGTSEIVIGDVDGDKTDELLLTAANSRILKLTPDGRWQTLWASPESADEKNRFRGFRFEDFATLGADPVPQIIALAKSNVRENPTRYMTGYVYKNGTLVQKWRVFSGLINLQAGDIDGDGENELSGYLYRQQHIFILEKHNLPVVQFLYVLTAALIIRGFYLQRLRKRTVNRGGEADV